MHISEIQVLLYGPDIARLSPTVSHPGVELLRTVRTTNPDYLFLYLEISEEARPGIVHFQLMHGESLIMEAPFPLLEREEDSARRRGFDPSDSIYLITPDRFANGNPENDAVAGMGDPPDRSQPYGRHGGDLEGIMNHLDYIHDLGFTAIWINPVLENRMPEWSYHGYAITDFYAVDPRFGSNEQYRELVRMANARGMKVIADMVLNHVGSNHWFVIDPPAEDWINFGGKPVITNHRRTTVQDPYASPQDARLHADGWFVEAMPDLNQRNPLLADYLIMNTLWWIEYAGFSGIRMDTWPYPDKDFLSRWACVVMEEYPHFNIVGEEWSLQPAVISYWQRGKENHDGYQSCLPSLMDFPLQGALVEGLTGPEKEYESALVTLYEALALDFLYADPENLLIFPDNHDMARFHTQMRGDTGLFKMGMVYFATMRGIPQFYYGTEILMNSDADPDSHGIIRGDFPGGWPADPVNAFTGEGLDPERKAVQEWMARLLNWRKDASVIHSGLLMHFAPEDGMYVYFRYNGEETVMVVLNKNKEAKPLGWSRYAERSGGYTTARDVLSGAEFSLDSPLVVPPRTALVLELDGRRPDEGPIGPGTFP